MACIIQRGDTRLFVSYGPGTASTSLEQHLRTHEGLLVEAGYVLSHYPDEAFGQGADTYRHICYADYLAKTGDSCSFVATGTRHPFRFYFAEYKRILSKWCKLLDDPHSWIYSAESHSTLRLTLLARATDSFDTWFYNVLAEALPRGYLCINEDHLNMATHFIRTEDVTASFDQIGNELFGQPFSALIGPFPVVNTSGYEGHYASEMREDTKVLGLQIFGHYLSRFGYSVEDSSGRG